MAKNLDCIPYDVFYQVASKLGCDDYIHLSRVNRSLHTLMKNESIARNTVRGELLHTKEGRIADQSKKGYRSAIGRLYDIRESIATAQPYSASIIGYGRSFLYKNGSLCYIYNDEIRSLDIHGHSRVEQVLNLPNVLRRAIPRCNPEKGMTRVSLMNYSDWIVAFLVELDDRHEAWLLAVDLRQHSSYGKSGRLRVRTRLDSTKRLFVRHNRTYLYYGAHSILGSRGYYEWAIGCLNLKIGPTDCPKVMWLKEFAGSEINQTACFEIYKDHLYAVSTLIDFEEEEIDWTSYYVWTCLHPSIKASKEGFELHKTWRRQHREGPINDTWSDLSLREDEATGQLIILECRREWQLGGSDNCRTYYIQPLPAPEDVGKQQPDDFYLTASLPDEPIAKAIDPNGKPHYEPPRKRLRRHYHSEYDDCAEPKHDFILAKTKFRTYNPSASSYIDLVNDPLPSCSEGDLVPRDRIRLRVVSRKRKCPIDEKGLLLLPELNDDRRLVEGSEEHFISRGVHLWPPDDAPKELNHLLCPSKRTGQVQGMADDRSIVYSVNQDGLAPGDQAIILINFDPSHRLPGLKTMSLKSGFEGAAEAAVGIERPNIGNIGKERTAIPTTVEGKLTNQNLPSVREEPALYLKVGRGYWFR